MSDTRYRTNWPLLFAALIHVLMLALLSKNVMASSIGLGICLVSLVMPRIELDRVGQLILFLVGGAAAYGVIMLPGEPEIGGGGKIGSMSTLFAFGALLWGAPRLFLKKPMGGDGGTAGLIFVAVLAMGGVSQGVLYPIGATVILILLALAVGFRDPLRPTFRALSRQYRNALLFIGAMFALVFTGMSLALPYAYMKAFRLMEAQYSGNQTGFNYILSLGDLDGMMQSDRKVMRLYGQKADHLRGVVYTRYVKGRWLGSKYDESHDYHGAKDDVWTTDIRLLNDSERYFVPLGAEKVHLDHDGTVDSGGVYYSKLREAARVRFVSGDAPLEPAPREDNSAVPDDIRPSLEGFLKTEGIPTLDSGSDSADETAVLRQIVRKLRQMEYALSVNMPADVDPVIGFLTVTRKGHCEYFASAAALLTRVAGIPSRLVGGYRVHEWNGIGEYYVVRERNAHSWIEVYIDGAWRTVDPTPSMEVMGHPAQTPFIFALMDAASAGLSKGGAAMSELGPYDVGIMVLVLLLFWGGIRIVRRFRMRHRRTQLEQRRYADVLPELQQFLLRLEKQGAALKQNETIDEFAYRLSRMRHPGFDHLSASALLIRYADWRFGDRGDVSRLCGELKRWEG